MHPHPHGATANLEWSFVSSENGKLTMVMNPEDIGGTVAKEIGLIEGHRAIYQKHTVSGIEGSFNYGHHPILKFPAKAVPLKFAFVPSPTERSIRKHSKIPPLAVTVA